MCPHGTTDTVCPLCVTQVSFTREQISFLEDLLVNKGCMQAIYNGRFSAQPEKCYECADRLEGIVDQIRAMKMAVASERSEEIIELGEGRVLPKTVVV